MSMRIAPAFTSMNAVSVTTNAIKSIGTANLVKAISSLAVPTIVMNALANLPQAFARREPRIEPIDENMIYVQCMDACDKIPHEGFKLACYTSCWLADQARKKWLR